MNKTQPSPHPAWATAHRKTGTELKKIKNKYYLYGVKSVYDKVTKRTKKVSLGIIGRISEGEGLVPSDKGKLRTRLKDAAPAIINVADKEYGFSFYLYQQVQIEILPALKQSFPDDWAMIIALVYCRILYQSPLKNIPFHLSCSSLLQLFLMDCPGETEVSQTLRRIGKQRSTMVQYMQRFTGKEDCVLVDATDIACNSSKISLSQKGYNSDMNFEPQVTLLYIYSARKHRPLFFRMVAGNIKDVSILKNALMESGISNAVYISDKGFYSETNLTRLDELQMKYIIPLRRDNKAINYALLDKIEAKQSYFKFRNRYIFYATQQHGDKQICLFLDGRLKEDEKTDYLNRITTLPEQYTTKGYREKIKAMGTIALLHNGSEIEKPEDVYENYKSRGEIEQFFDCYKNTIDAYVSHMQNEDALHGWMFINHVAMQITYELFEQLKSKKLTKWHSIKDVILHLSQIRRVQINESQSFISEINKKTKDILAKLKISVT
jgi:transposase